MHEKGHDCALIELCLAHADGNKVRAVYNKSERLAERGKFVQAWSDYCDEIASV
jgi:hypothetical protein